MNRISAIYWTKRLMVYCGLCIAFTACTTNKKEQTMEAYEAPRVKVIEVEVEQGYALSGEMRGEMPGEGNIH